MNRLVFLLLLAAVCATAQSFIYHQGNVVQNTNSRSDFSCNIANATATQYSGPAAQIYVYSYKALDSNSIPACSSVKTYVSFNTSPLIGKSLSYLRLYIRLQSSATSGLPSPPAMSPIKIYSVFNHPPTYSEFGTTGGYLGDLGGTGFAYIGQQSTYNVYEIAASLHPSFKVSQINLRFDVETPNPPFQPNSMHSQTFTADSIYLVWADQSGRRRIIVVSDH